MSGAVRIGYPIALKQNWEAVQIKKEFSPEETQKEFQDIQAKYLKYSGTIFGASAFGLLLGSLRYGAEFPAKTLRVVGDAFASIVAIITPFMITKNETNDYKLFKHGKKTPTSTSADSINELFYRCVSLGFSPYIFESLINPKEITRSNTTKLATLFNIPYLIFTFSTMFLGNISAIIAWSYRTKEQYLISKKEEELNKNNDYKIADLEHSYKKLECYNRLYGSTKRLAVLGGIALPTMHGIKRFAEGWDYLVKGDMSLKEFFSQPFLAISRTISLVIGLPEAVAKGYDSFARIAQERDHLKAALPKILCRPLDLYGKFFDRYASSKSNNFLKASRNLAEIIFHTLSPVSNAAFIAPILHQPAYNKDVQGGIPFLLDRSIGTYGKLGLYLFTIPYAFISRLPQTIFQSIYFGRYYYGKIIKKENNEKIKISVDKMQNSICNFTPIKYISNKANALIEYLVPNYNDLDHKFNLPSFVIIQIKESFNQTKEVYKNLLQKGKSLTYKEKEEIINFAINYIQKNALRAYQTLNTNELQKIRKGLELKIEETLDPSKVKLKTTNVRFPGALFIAHFLKPFDFKERLNALDTNSPFHRMETAYQIDELAGFEKELYIMLSECAASGLRNTINRALR